MIEAQRDLCFRFGRRKRGRVFTLYIRVDLDISWSIHRPTSSVAVWTGQFAALGIRSKCGIGSSLLPGSYPALMAEAQASTIDSSFARSS
jgi:hypothetical protein